MGVVTVRLAERLAETGREGVSPSVRSRQWECLEDLPFPAAGVDAEGVVRACNAAWLEVTPLVGGGVGHRLVTLGRSLTGGDVGVSRSLAEGLRSVLSGETRVSEVEFAEPGGEERWASLVLSAASRGASSAVLVQRLDVTERRRSARMRSLLQCFAGLAEVERSRDDFRARSLGAVCDLLGWPLVALWTYEASTEQLRCDGVLPSRGGSRGWSTLRAQESIALRAWRERRPCWGGSMMRDDLRVARVALQATSVGLDETLALPIGRGGRLEGVAVFYVPRGPRLDDGFVTALARALGGGTARVDGAVALAHAQHESLDDAGGEIEPKVLRRSLHDQQVKLAAESMAPLVVRGEAGVGKLHLVREIHASSGRAAGACVVVDCAALSQRDLETELFGVEASGPTGRAQRGLFESANGGTLIFDEVSTLDLDAQSKIARVLETRSFRRKNGSRDVKFDARVVATTRQDLGALVVGGRFREDLYYRLHVMALEVLPLRARAEELAGLVDGLLGLLARQYERGAPKLAPGALELLAQHGWPGNVRELRNVLERAWLGVGDEIGPMAVRAALGQPVMPRPTAKASAAPAAPAAATPEVSSTSIRDQERQWIITCLEQTHYNIRQTAARLGISRSTLYQRVRSYGINIDDARGNG
ncbi:MAG: sigma 54-interacting transcriptional regulator [Myxococcales bacterium]|nr:sigma 54-interacting transcriptional regulator [Myxococcales bacterium]